MTDPGFSLSYDEWSDPAAVARELERGADPNSPTRGEDLVLGCLVRDGSADTLSMVLPRVDDVDELGEGVFDEGRTALWNAVYEGRPDLAALTDDLRTDAAYRPAATAR